MKPVKLYLMDGGFVVAFAATTRPEYALAPSGETAADDRPRVEQPPDTPSIARLAITDDAGQ